MALVAICVLVFSSCQGASLVEKDTGVLRLTIAGGPETSRNLGSRDIDANVTTVEVKMTSVPSDLYPPKMASAVFNAGGTTVSIGQVKVGTWKVELFLNDTTGNQLYYGSSQVTISAGATTTASIEVFKTGTADITVTEGVDAPTLTPGTPNMVAKTYPLTITFPSSVQKLASNYIKYTVGTEGATPADPVQGTATGSNDDIINLPMDFTDTIKVKLFLADGRSSAVQTLSYSRPYFSLAQSSYTGFQNVTLQSMRAGTTIRYTVSDALPGAEPTYEYGTLAGNGTVVQLQYPTSVLKAVSYYAGEPDSVSDIASATYTLNVAPKIEVYINGSTKVLNGTGTLDFGISSPDADIAGSILILNAGDGQDLVLAPIYAAITGTDSTRFQLGSSLVVQKTLLDGEATTIPVNFTPGGSTGTKNAVLTIYSNDPTDPSFAVALTAAAYDAPSVALLSGIEVAGAGDSVVNGLYNWVTDNKNGYTGYGLSGTTNTYLYYSTYGNRYSIGYDSGWGSISSAYADMYSAATTYRYYKNTATTNPIGLTTTWTSNGGGASPVVTRITGGLNGKDLTDIALAGFMTTGRQLKVYYTASAGAGDSAATPTFKWYRRSISSDPWSIISGATAQTYTLTDTPSSGTQFKVEVTPTAASGLVGATQTAMVTVP